MSHKIFVISDFHFSHKNMALHRGFVDVEEHDEHIIKMYNSVVRKKDTVYILGDVTMEASHPYKLLQRLCGIKNVILGNHDQRTHVPELLKYINSVAGMIKLKDCWLTHCPIHPNQMGKNLLNLHGHCLDVDSEILTKFGWKKYNEISINDEIYSYNSINNKLEYDIIKNIIIHEKYNGKMFHMKGKGITFFYKF